MRTTVIFAFLTVAILFALSGRTVATCGDTWVASPPTFGPDGVQFHCLPQLVNPTNTTKTVHTVIYWLDGYSRAVDVTDYGQNRDIRDYSGHDFEDCVRCYPEFQQPFWEETGNTAYWDQITRQSYCEQNGLCLLTSAPVNHHRNGHICGTTANANCTTPGWDGSCPVGTSPDGFGMCCGGGSPTCTFGQTYNYDFG